MLFILNKSMKIIGSLNDRGNMSKITPYFDDSYIQDLASGAETFSFSTTGNSPQSKNLTVGNFIAFRHKKEYKLFNIINIEEEHSETLIKTVYCEMASIELINEIIRPVKFSGTVVAFVKMLLQDTSWNVGMVDMGINETVDLDLTSFSSVYALLQEHIVNSFKCEISYSVEIKNNEIVNKFVNIFLKRGVDNGVRFAYSKNLPSIKRTIDTSELATALIGVGKNNITFKEVDVEDKPLGQDFIENDYAYKIWNVNGHHILGTHNADTDSPQELLLLTRKALEERSTPKVKYEMKVELLNSEVEIGDTVKIVDHEFNPPIYLEGRVNQLKISKTDSTMNECILANFKELGTNISAELKELAGYVDSQFPIGGDKIQDGAIGGDKLENGQIITGTHLFANSISADKIMANSIISDKIMADQILSKHIKAGEIEAEHIKSGTITADKITSDEFITNSAQIKDAIIGTAQIGDAQITVAKIQDLFADSIVASQGKFESAHIGVLTSDNISADTINAEHITASVVDAINMNVSGKITADKIDVSGLVVDNIDAGKITTGSLDANRIGANTIDASKLTITDMTNLATKLQDKNVDKVFDLVNRDNYVSDWCPMSDIETGSEFIFEGYCKRKDSSTTLSLNVYIFVKYTDNSIEYLSGEFCKANEASDWIKKSKTLKIDLKPEKIPHSYALVMQIPESPSDASSQNWQVKQMTIRRKGNGKLIVDGSITADKIFAGTITGDKINSNQIDTQHLKANSITSDKIMANSIISDKIESNQILAKHIKAGEIEVGHINSETINAIGISASEITADKIASGEIQVGNANIVDGTISGAKISKATITNAQIDSAFIADAYIKNLDAGKITTGSLDANKVTIKNLRADSIIAGSITVEGNNLIKNASFKNNFDKWANDAGVSGTIDTTTIRTPEANSVKMKHTTSAGYVSGVIPCKQGESFVGSIYVKTSSSFPSNGVTLFILPRNKDGGDIHNDCNRFNIDIKPNTDWQRLVFSCDIPEGAVSVGFKFRSNGNFDGWFTQPMLSRGTIASVWKAHNDELISDGAIGNDQLGDGAVTSDKLLIDELFVGENAFINSLKAVEIDASNITTGKISGERIDISGLISFEALDSDLQQVFDVTGDKTYINGGMIATNTIKADKIDLLSGLTVKRKDGATTFAVSNDGEVNIDGQLKSANFDESKNLGYQITKDGVAIFNQAKISGEFVMPNAGVTNYGATIGNENLILNSNFINNLANWESHDMSSGGTEKSLSIATGGDWCPIGYKILQIRGTNTNARYGVLSSAFVLKTNTKYTISGFCAGHRTGSIQVNVREIDKASANIHTVNYAPVTGGNSFDKWTRFETTFTTGSTVNYALNLYSQNMGNNGFVWFGQIKFEEGEKATPWCPHKVEQIDHIRIWAGSPYANRDTAPFRVTQNGDIFATKGVFTGTVSGEYKFGQTHIHNNEIVLDKQNNYHFNPRKMMVDNKKTKGVVSNPAVKLGVNDCIFDTDITLGSLNDKRISYSNTNRFFDLRTTDFKISANGLTSLEFDATRGNGAFNGLNLIAKIGGGHHILRHSASPENAGTMIIDSEGSQGANGDFCFTRKNFGEHVKVVIDGELTVKNSIKSKIQNIEMRSVSGEGWGYYAT